MEPVNHKAKWTHIQEKILVEQYAKGTAIKIIADTLGRTEVATLQRLATLDLIEFNAIENAYFTVPAKVYQF